MVDFTVFNFLLKAGESMAGRNDGKQVLFVTSALALLEALLIYEFSKIINKITEPQIIAILLGTVVGVTVCFLENRLKIIWERRVIRASIILFVITVTYGSLKVAFGVSVGFLVSFIGVLFVFNLLRLGMSVMVSRDV